MEDQPTSVPTERGRVIQVGEAWARRRQDGPWAWTEPSVWTGRMLTALEKGVKGGVWFSLIDKAWSLKNLRAAFAKVKAKRGSAGVDHQTIEMFEGALEDNLQRLRDELRGGTYQPQAIRRHWIPKPGSREQRPLGIPTVRDRVVQAAVRHVLEPIFERDFAEHSYGFRPGRGCKDALRRVDALLREGRTIVVDADLKGYFDTIPHTRLMQQIRTRVADGRLLDLIERYLTQGILDGMERWTPTAGTPQGAVLSPLLANIYLDGLDHLMATHGYEMVRYADDFVILCRSETEARAALALVERWVTERGLTLHPEKTGIADANQGGFTFLGYFFCRGHRWPSTRSKQKLKEAIRVRTRRTSGQSLSVIVDAVNPILRGWYVYFKHARPGPFSHLDGWVRMRLRSILRRRRGGRGRGHGRDHQRWPNAYFTELGLFSLRAANTRDRQSALR